MMNRRKFLQFLGGAAVCVTTPAAAIDMLRTEKLIIPTDRIAHVVVVSNGVNEVRLYVNGQLVSADTDVKLCLESVSKDARDQLLYLDRLNGEFTYMTNIHLDEDKISNIAVYDRMLTNGERTKLLEALG